jgi:hypothetical protein
MSDTPETDEASFDYNAQAEYWVDAEFAKKLERERDEARRQASVWEKLASMSDSALNDWCVRHDLHGCLDGDCGERRCIWCGEEVYEVLDEITKQEEANETL